MHRDFAAAKARALHEPITFTFAGEAFQCMERPSLGDTFELMDAPDPTPENEAQCARLLAGFVRRLLIPADKPRWDRVLLEVPVSEAVSLIELGVWLAEAFTLHPSKPPVSSSGGRRTSGRTSKRPTVTAVT